VCVCVCVCVCLCVVCVVCAVWCVCVRGVCVVLCECVWFVYVCMFVCVCMCWCWYDIVMLVHRNEQDYLDVMHFTVHTVHMCSPCKSVTIMQLNQRSVHFSYLRFNSVFQILTSSTCFKPHEFRRFKPFRRRNKTLIWSVCISLVYVT